MVVYIDDIFIFTDNMDFYQQLVKQVLQKLKNNNLFTKPSKCTFHVPKIEYLGFIVSSTGISMDKEKIKAVTEWEPPKSVHDIQVFLGFANFYRRFIKDFGKITRPFISKKKVD